MTAHGPDLVERVAQEAWQAYVVEVGRALPPGMADKIARAVLIAIMQTHALVELPELSHGPDGQGQYSFDTRASTVSATPDGRVWQEDFDMEPHEAEELAAALLAAARAAEEQP